MSAVFSLLPHAGLGNKLLVWARGAAFAEVNGLPHYTIGWSHLSPGTLLRGGRRRPLYGRSFRGGIGAMAQAWRLLGPTVREPAIASAPPGTYAFAAIPAWQDYFAGLREHREAVRRRFFAAYRHRVPAAPEPFLALHVRLGDFRPADDRPFAEQGQTRTPTDYFVETATAMRAAVGRTIPIRVFSDGSDADLAELLALPACSRHLAATDAEELVAMSQAAAIVCSASSTFSMWAGYLGDAVLIHHPQHFHNQVRPDLPGLWEGPWPGSAEPLLDALRRQLAA